MGRPCGPGSGMGWGLRACCPPTCRPALRCSGSARCAPHAGGQHVPRQPSPACPPPPPEPHRGRRPAGRRPQGWRGWGAGCRRGPESPGPAGRAGGSRQARLRAGVAGEGTSRGGGRPGRDAQTAMLTGLAAFSRPVTTHRPTKHKLTVHDHIEHDLLQGRVPGQHVGRVGGRARRDGRVVRQVAALGRGGDAGRAAVEGREKAGGAQARDAADERASGGRASGAGRGCGAAPGGRRPGGRRAGWSPPPLATSRREHSTWTTTGEPPRHAEKRAQAAVGAQRVLAPGPCATSGAAPAARRLDARQGLACRGRGRPAAALPPAAPCRRTSWLARGSLAIRLAPPPWLNLKRGTVRVRDGTSVRKPLG